MITQLFSDDQLKSKNLDVLKRFLRHKLGGYIVSISDIRTDNLFYRGVRWQQLPSKVDQVSYPPPDCITKLGRANPIGIPVFYASRAAPAVFFELRSKPGDLIALSEWQVLEPLWMHHLGYHKDALLRMGVSDIGMRPRLTYPIPKETKENANLRKRLSIAFTEDIREGREYRYKQSIAINELLFDGASPFPLYPDGPKSTRAAGTVYPSMQMRGAADNVAIWPEFVDRALRLRSVRYILVEAADEAMPSYTLLTQAKSNEFRGSDLIWHSKLGSEELRRSSIALEGGNWVARDGFNRIYDHHWWR